MIKDYLYYFHNQTSEDIVEQYKLSKYTQLNHEQQIEGIKLLEEETLKQLSFYYNNDLDNIILQLESIRFLIICIYNQYYPIYDFIPYYKKILNFFHEKGYLKFKNNFSIYKTFRKKTKVNGFIHYKYLNIEFKLKYSCYKNLITDYGLVGARVINDLLHTKEDKTIDFNSIINIIYTL